MTANNSGAPWRITVAYAAAAAAWILFSDSVLSGIGLPDNHTWQVGTAKGLLFVLATSALLFVLVRRLVARSQAAEAALRESQVRWEFALDAAGDGIWDWNVETGAVFFSPRCLAIFDFLPGEIAPRIEEWQGRIHPDDAAEVQRSMQHHFVGKTPGTVTKHRLRTKGGGYKWVLTRGKVIERTSEGRPRRMLGVATDITESHLAQARAAEALALSNVVIQSSPVGIITFQRDGTTVTANEAAARMAGASVGELLAQNFRRLASWKKYGLLFAADRALAEQREIEHTTEMVTTFGRRVRLALRFAPFTFQGEQRLLAVLIDETEKHRAEQELQLTRAALQASPVAWIITDANGTIEWVNPAFAKLTGYAADEVLGRNPRFLRSGDHPPEFYQQMWETILRGEVWEADMRNRRKDGTLYHERMVIAPVRDATGGIGHFVAMQQDITNERELEQQLNRAQRLESIGMLASGIAHDLNNVLAPIVLSMELLKLKFPQPDVQPALNVVEQAAQRGVGIVRQVLTFARGVDGERGPVPTRQLVRDVAKLIEETFPRNIEVRVQTDADAGMVRGDLTQLHQVLLNLAVNARDAMPGGGVIALSARNAEVDVARSRRSPPLQPGPHIVLGVADNGSGIPSEVLDHIFEPFFTTKPRGKGTGLGLSTVHGIVRSHGGAIDVSTAPETGTQFALWLPRQSEPTNAPVNAAAAHGGISGAGRRVLLVDDEPAIVDVTRQVLQRRGFDVHVAADGMEALALFRTAGPWDVVLADRMMPRLDGVALATAIHDSNAAIPVILMSGVIDDPASTDDAMRTDCAAAGIRTLLAKPFTEEELFDALRRELRPADDVTAAKNPEAGWLPPSRR
ncbi:MAG: hypothetical protein C0518_01970 [Opitutus sp.]|nr:hypothetical protein [Opitutus sp.]